MVNFGWKSTTVITRHITPTSHTVRCRAMKPYFPMVFRGVAERFFYHVAHHLDPGQLASEPLDFLALLVLQRPLNRFAYRTWAQLFDPTPQHAFVHIKVLGHRGNCVDRLQRLTASRLNSALNFLWIFPISHSPRSFSILESVRYFREIPVCFY